VYIAGIAYVCCEQFAVSLLTLLLIYHSIYHYCSHILKFFMLLIFYICNILLNTVIMFDYNFLKLLIILNCRSFLSSVYRTMDTVDDGACAVLFCDTSQS